MPSLSNSSLALPFPPMKADDSYNVGEKGGLAKTQKNSAPSAGPTGAVDARFVKKPGSSRGRHVRQTAETLPLPILFTEPPQTAP